ncbi:alpha/beta hydrolase [Conexibacter stalactiti]|uniref:Alpha/beta hydrolase n=1 Tax=Conexibacter stalactiti TaxID=1940611 RepID=A0ABU4HHG7_9ACTN|nr:alpha/beta hydrolase [Conexibacter stalactiti]MDW5592722.1 alpha/beta hydrolase [Conexibacter stalactiti]MEC5033363.1 alpha/beta hydrolase [Conexibacter stalactiti]
MTTDALLGDDFETRLLPLAPDAEGEQHATLIRLRPADAGSDGDTVAKPTRAVLYVHGFVDYFFQRELAAYYRDRGFAFYALDLRKSGRSLRPHQTPYFVRSVSEWYEELDAAADAIRADGATQLLVNGHSTGGLAAALWAHARRDDAARRPDALFLNSPFLSLNAAPLVRAAGATLAALRARTDPYAVMPAGLSELYVQSIHSDHRGEWSFDLELKPVEGVPVRAGWLRAVHAAHRRVARGLDVRGPILVLCSAASSRPKAWDEILLRSDSVLDAEQIARRATRLGRHVTCVRIDDGMHDLVLSAPPVRAQVYAELGQWLDAYLPA